MNDIPAEELRGRLAAAVPVPRWVDAVVARAPFPDLNALLAAFRDEIDRSRASELADIATRETRQAPAGKDGLAPSEEGTGAAWARGDRVYEERFGHPLVLDANGLSDDEVLEELQRRLTNSPDEEAAETRRQLRRLVEAAIRTQFAEQAT